MSPWKRSLIVAAAMMSASAVTLSAQTLRGQVVDSITSEPIRAMEMVLIDVRGDTVAVARSNSEGRFAVELSRAGAYTISCRCMGHRPKEVTINLESDDYITIRMAPIVVPP